MARSLCSVDHAMVWSSKGSELPADFGFRLITVPMLSRRHAVRVLLAVMTALPVAGAAVQSAYVTGTHPRLTVHARSAGQVGSVIEADSGTQTASGTQSAPPMVAAASAGDARHQR